MSASTHSKPDLLNDAKSSAEAIVLRVLRTIDTENVTIKLSLVTIGKTLSDCLLSFDPRLDTCQQIVTLSDGAIEEALYTLVQADCAVHLAIELLHSIRPLYGLLNEKTSCDSFADGASSLCRAASIFLSYALTIQRECTSPDRTKAGTRFQDIQSGIIAAVKSIIEPIWIIVGFTIDVVLGDHPRADKLGFAVRCMSAGSAQLVAALRALHDPFLAQMQDFNKSAKDLISVTSLLVQSASSVQPPDLEPEEKKEKIFAK